MSEETTVTETPKRGSLCKKVVDPNSSSVTFTFSDDVVVVISPNDFPAEIQARLLQYGIQQKFGDAYAGCKTAKEARDEQATVIAQLVKGEWAVRSTSTGPKAGKTVQAIVNIGVQHPKAISKLTGLPKDGITIEAVREWFVGKTAEERKALTATKEIKIEIAEMNLRDAQSSETSLLS